MPEDDIRMIGGFRVEGALKSSGMQGRVYKAVCDTDDLSWCRRGTVVALKTMQVGADAETAWERLRLQTESLVNLNHPNVVRYFGCFVEQSAFSEIHVVVQEFLHGESLKTRLADCPSGLDADEAVKIINGMVSGLAAATDAGIVHRDIKPDNVFLCTDGSVKLIDFEVARQTDCATSVSGNMVGSFDYMAPDFANPHFSGDVKSDIFSAGVVMHEILTGKLPYRRFTGQVQQASFAFLERWSKDNADKFIKGSCSISTSVDRVVAHMRPILSKALSLQREARYDSFSEIKSALSDVRFRDLKNGGTSYRILQIIGKGGFGEVFKARAGGRTVAIKHLLKPEYAARFFREAKIMSELNDSCFVRFYDFFVLQHAGAQEAFLVMDFLPGMPGSSLRDAIRRSAGCGLDFEHVIKAFIRYAHGLKMIHDKGVYHRDIKPTNLYYPEDRPESASIMDLGIARDESGTETTGQVPGTLDYMPPETALGDTRGNAGMDVYALGLCLYEALSGKKGFPRLPTGSQGYAQFFQRAKEKRRPAFDDPRVASHVGLLELLRKMTEPELSDRLADAGQLEHELRNVLEGGSLGAYKPPAAAAEASSSVSETDDEESETCATAFLPQSELPKEAVKIIDDGLRKFGGSRGNLKSKIFMWSVSGVLFCAAAIAVFILYRTELDCLVARLLQQVPRRVEVYDDASTVLDGEDREIPNVYGDDSSSMEQADSLRDRWLADRKPVMSEHEYVRAVTFFERKREQRIIRNRLDSEHTKFVAVVMETVKVYLENGVAAGDDRKKKWLETWGAASKYKIDGAMRLFDKARRDRLDIDAAKALLPRASAAVDRIVKSYADNGIKLADREADMWRHDWSRRLLKEDCERLSARMTAARNEILRKIAEKEKQIARKSLFSECRALLEMLTPVQSRDSRLFEAETKMKQARASGLVDGKECADFLKEVEIAKGWTVFEIVNRSDLDLTVAGVQIKNTASHVFAYSNTPPESLSVECFGYESFPLGSQTDGKRLVLLPEHFAMLKVEVSVGVMEEGVTCRIDGISVAEKVVRLVPGSHECVYSKKDYKNQVIPFRIDPGTSVSLPKPGEWARSEDWLQRERDRKRAEQAKILEVKCAGFLLDEPISNRVDRLSECGKILRDWKTPDVLGEHRHKALSAALAAAERISIGAVVNDTRFEFEAKVGGETVKFPSHARMMVKYPSKAPLEAELFTHGYVPIPFPQKFCGVDFRVVSSMVKPSPVEVSIREKPDDVVCVVNGEERKGASFKLLPGEYKIQYMRPDYKDVQSTFTVNVGEPLKLNCPYKWEASEGMVNLIAAETAADSGAWNRVKTLLGYADVRGEDGIKRKMALNLRYEQRKRFLKRLDEASSAYYEERWHDVVKLYFDLKLNGYSMTKEDRHHASVAIKKRSEHLEMLKKIAGTGDFGTSMEKIDAEIRSFEAMSGLILKEINAAEKRGR